MATEKGSPKLKKNGEPRARGWKLSFSAEHREKISRAAKKRFKNPAYRERLRAIRLGTKVSDATKQKIRESFARKWADPVQRELIRAQKLRAAQNIKRPTFPERRFASILDAAGIAYSFQVRIDRYLVDFLIAPNIVIEVDGERWHSARVESDAVRDRRLAELGYRVIRIPAKALRGGQARSDLANAPTICVHCKKVYRPLRRGLCAACNQYKRMHGGAPRPLDGSFLPRARSLGDNAGKTACKNGHLFDETNTYIDGRNRRHCRACGAARALNYRRLAKAMIAGETGDNAK